MTNPSLRQWVVVGENDEEVTKNSILRYTLKIVLFVIVVQPMLNYAALKHGREYLMLNVTLYDVGFGQKLNMSCIGDGRLTVICDIPQRVGFFVPIPWTSP